MPLHKKTEYLKKRMIKDPWGQKLWNEAKSEAALEGISMTDWTIKAFQSFILVNRKMREKLSPTSMSKA